MKEFISFLSQQLDVDISNIKGLVFAKDADFTYCGENYVVVSGHLGTCHVVAEGDDARISLLRGLYGDAIDEKIHEIHY
ncbi:hypothetical protein [Sphingomonas canadensis]|uniref:hypothetical protein n=1 Tax=Sphingomonas canadensis TaxID=1219257 RepID=UPI00222F0944|nr:hypothetical protein [Sphingomonas canadensis]